MHGKWFFLSCIWREVPYRYSNWHLSALHILSSLQLSSNIQPFQPCWPMFRRHLNVFDSAVCVRGEQLAGSTGEWILTPSFNSVSITKSRCCEREDHSLSQECFTRARMLFLQILCEVWTNTLNIAYITAVNLLMFSGLQINLLVQPLQEGNVTWLCSKHTF